MSLYTQINFRTFELPPGYSEKIEYSEEQIFMEDLNNNDMELWLFQAPQEFDFSSLKSKKVSMNGETVFQNEDCLMSGKSHKISVFSRSDSELPDYQLLLPSRSNGGLFLAPLPLAGQVNLTEYVSKPSPVFPSFSPEKEKEDISVLRQRYSPFGSGEPLTTPKHKPLVKSNTSNADKSIERPISAKKKVTFKMPLTETQEQNILEKAESSNQEVSVSLEASILEIAFKQNKSNKKDTCQENESPNKAKSKKKPSPFPKDSESRSRLFEETKIPDVMLQYEETENPIEQKTDFHLVNAKNLNIISNNNELLCSVGHQDDSTRPRKSKKKRKVDKSLRNDCEEDEITIKNAVLSSHETDDSQWSSIQNSKKKKKKSKKHADLGGKSMEDFTPKAKSLAPEVHNSGSQDSKCSSVVDKLETSAVVDNISICSNEQSFPFAQQSYKKTKRKKESSGKSDSSQYDKKSKRRKLSNFFQESKEEILKTALNIKQEVFSDNEDKSFSKQKLSDMKTKMKNEIKPDPDSGHLALNNHNHAEKKKSNALNIKQEVFSDSEDKSFSKQKLSDMKTKMKNEIKPDPDSGHLELNNHNHAEKKKSKNAEENKSAFNKCKKYKKSKKHEKE